MVLCEFCGYEAVDKVALTFHKKSDKYCVSKQKQKIKNQFTCEYCHEILYLSEQMKHQHIIDCKIDNLKKYVDTIDEKVDELFKYVYAISNDIKQLKTYKEKEEKMSHLEEVKSMIENKKDEVSSKYHPVYIMFN